MDGKHADGISGKEIIKMKRKAVIIAMGIVLAVSFVLVFQKPGEKQESVKEAKEDDGYRIGMTVDTFILERWTKDRDVFVSTAQKLGASVDVQSANGDVEKQRRQIEKFMEEGMDVIVVIAVDSYGLTDVVEEARSRGIRVMSYDRLIQGTMTDLFITVDSEMVGQEMAQTILKSLPDGGDVVMICGPESDANSTDMVQGFEDVIADSSLNIVRKTYAKSWVPEYGFQAVAEAFHDVTHMDAVMCGNDGLAGYAIKALSEQQLAGSVAVVGQDADLEACQRIVEGTQTMTVYKPIEQLAVAAAEHAVKLAAGRQTENAGAVKQTEDGLEVPYVGLEPIAVTVDNMDEVIVDSGFHLRDEVYLNVEE